jgi:hypothetical protein
VGEGEGMTCDQGAEGLKTTKSIKNAIDFNRIFLKIDSK